VEGCFLAAFGDCAMYGIPNFHFAVRYISANISHIGSGGKIIQMRIRGICTIFPILRAVNHDCCGLLCPQ